MKILGIETSCDETAAAVVEDGTQILSNVVASSEDLHRKTGGIVPEVAAREQIRSIIPVIQEALSSADLHPTGVNLDSIAVTVGPGLVGSLLVGVETAKVLSFVWQKPLIPVNHLTGHIYANFLLETRKTVQFPAVVLIVSGGHTDLVLMQNHGSFKWLGGTRDDAAGEAFDKVAKMLNLDYPGGPAIQKAAKNGDPAAYNLPRPLIESHDFDFSFSGLKTAVLRQIKDLNPSGLELKRLRVNDLGASFQQAVVETLTRKTIRAAQKYQAKTVLLAGGVAANTKLRQELKAAIQQFLPSTPYLQPPIQYCTDNAAMVASAAYFNYKPIPYNQVKANPNLHF